MERREGVFTIRDFAFRTGEVLEELRLGYTTLGAPARSPSGEVANGVLLLHGTTGTGASWLRPSLADTLFGPGQPLDGEKYYLILPDSIGLGKSSKPSDGLKSRFPQYGYLDMVESQRRLVTEGLGVSHLRLVMGTSMGGMHTWLWAERYPTMMDGAVALTSEPAEISGRNLLWRRIITEAIRTDPAWRDGGYTETPPFFARVFPLFTLMVESARHLRQNAPDREKTIEYYNRLVGEATSLDANDCLYRFEASRDYNPWPDLEKITAPLLAINFTDDMINPPEASRMDEAMARLKTGKSILITPEGDKSLGHQNQSLGALWGPYVAEFLKELP